MPSKWRMPAREQPPSLLAADRHQSWLTPPAPADPWAAPERPGACWDPTPPPHPQLLHNPSLCRPSSPAGLYVRGHARSARSPLNPVTGALPLNEVRTSRREHVLSQTSRVHAPSAQRCRREAEPRNGIERSQRTAGRRWTPPARGSAPHLRLPHTHGGYVFNRNHTAVLTRVCHLSCRYRQTDTYRNTDRSVHAGCEHTRLHPSAKGPRSYDAPVAASTLVPATRFPRPSSSEGIRAPRGEDNSRPGEGEAKPGLGGHPAPESAPTGGCQRDPGAKREHPWAEGRA
ncbi:uncharacterized protein LOC111149839 isoform X2 [Enhydra lutris kenyoni]|uniref:Uncharacterized protein LOC111149839 isoform X2 n=1 Tax=Enhydra lutris kenyoni TaxID=391180 RepID=A0A2Y9JTI5_ENHLU|nr:uncharacterized protein LOC111149839 isoform X2 [Enhydra lutris kenyoni]